MAVNNDTWIPEANINRNSHPAAWNKAFNEARTIVINDYQSYEHAQASQIDRGVMSACAVPIRSGDQVLGLMSMGSNSANHFTKGIIELVTAFADEIGSLFETVGLTDFLQASQVELALADEISDMVNSVVDFDELGDKVTKRLKDLVDFDRATIATVDLEAQTVTIRYTTGTELPGYESRATYPMSQNGDMETLASGIPSFRFNLEEDAKHAVDNDLLGRGFRSSAVVPLISQGIFIGVIALRSYEVGVYGLREQAIVSRLANQIAPALENAILQERLVRGEAQNRALLETTSDAIITIDDTGLSQSFNPSAELMFGYSAKEIIGCDFSILMPQNNGGARYDYLPRYVSSYEPEIGSTSRQLDGQRRDGTIFSVELWVGVVESEEGRGFIGIMRRLDLLPEKGESELDDSSISRPSDASLPQLTKREIEVLNILAVGGRNKDVAEEMIVSLHTVKFHIENLYIKLGVRTRGELIRVATRFGFLEG